MTGTGKTQDLQAEIRTDAEAGEFWSHAGSKKNQRWTWYATERNSGTVPAWHNGRCTDEICSRLIEKLSVFDIKFYHADGRKSYSEHIPSHKHVTGKSGTWKTERKNLNFRTHVKRMNQKTICFSKNKKIHDNVIGMYISRYYFVNGLFSETA